MNDSTPIPSKSSRPLRVFLCHSSADKPTVRLLYRRLHEDGIDAWLDEENLLPGQDWRREIPKAVRNSDAVIVCLSESSVNKTGYLQKEIKFALDVADEQPEDTIFIIPVKFGKCDVPDRLSQWQWVNLFEKNGYERLMRALKFRAESLAANITLPPSQPTSEQESAPPQSPEKPNIVIDRSGGNDIDAERVKAKDIVGRDKIVQNTYNYYGPIKSDSKPKLTSDDLPTSEISIAEWSKRAKDGFDPIQFDSAEADRPYNYALSPTGHVLLGKERIPFILLEHQSGQGHRVIEVQPKHVKDQEARNIRPAEVRNVIALYVLLSAGDAHRTRGRERFEGKEIGRLFIQFYGDAGTQIVPLRLGIEIRDWVSGETRPSFNVVSTASASEEVWQSLDHRHTLDMLRIEIDGSPKDVLNLSVAADCRWLPESYKESFPSIRISGVTYQTAKSISTLTSPPLIKHESNIGRSTSAILQQVDNLFIERQDTLKKQSAKSSSAKTKRFSSERVLAGIVLFAAVATVIVALLNWLSPFNPVGNSPLAQNGGQLFATQTVAAIALIPTADPSPILTPAIVAPTPNPSATSTHTPTATSTYTATPSPTKTSTPTSTSTRTNAPNTIASKTLTPSRTPTPVATKPPSGDYIYSALTFGPSRQSITNGMILGSGSRLYFTIKNNTSNRTLMMSHRGIAVRYLSGGVANSYIDGRGLQWPGYEGQLGPGRSVEIEIIVSDIGCNPCEVFPSIAASWQDAPTGAITSEQWLSSPSHNVVTTSSNPSTPTTAIVAASLVSGDSHSIIINLNYTGFDTTMIYSIRASSPESSAISGYISSFTPTSTAGVTQLQIGVDNIYCKAGPFTTHQINITARENRSQGESFTSPFSIAHTWCSNP
jgi:hypothetical protein